MLLCRMPKMLQVRNLPDDVHEALRRKAANAGMSLSEYAARALRRLAAEPSLEEIFARAERRDGRFSFDRINEVIREDRDAH
jgi:plasmid stability protein